jgi:hypothetical protein
MIVSLALVIGIIFIILGLILILYSAYLAHRGEMIFPIFLVIGADVFLWGIIIEYKVTF